MVERFICTEKVKSSTLLISTFIWGGVMKLVYMFGLGPDALRRESSSLSTLIIIDIGPVEGPDNLLGITPPIQKVPELLPWTMIR